MQALWNDSNELVTVVQLTPLDDPTEVEALIRLFEGIALSENWQPQEALRRWQDRSVYFAMRIRNQLVGGLQLILPDAAGVPSHFPFQSVWPEVNKLSCNDSRNRSAHIAILAMVPSVRGDGKLFWHIVIEMWRYCVAAGIATIYLEVTPRVLPVYRRLGWRLVVRGALRQHWGEDCYLCSIGLPEVAEGLLRRSLRSRFYRQIIAQAFRVSLVDESASGPMDSPLTH